MLVGRSSEKHRLKAAIGDPATGLAIVQGLSGAGKTALIETTLAELCADGAIAGRGKYAQGSASSAFAPIMQALSQAVGSALDLLYDPIAGAASLDSVLGAQKALLAAAGFEALGPAPALAAKSNAANESAVQILEAAARVMQWLDGFGAPVILFVDDWQRAPVEAQTFAALAARGRGLCTVVLAERMEPGQAPAGVRHRGETIAVGPLSGEDRAALLGVASGNSGAGAAISEWLGATANSLPFDLLEASRVLQESGALSFAGGQWSIDAARAATIDRADFFNTIVRRARALPPDALELGVALALWGDRAELHSVAEALGKPFATVSLSAAALREAGIVRLADGVVSFIHDRPRAALLAAIEPQARAALAAAMAEHLAAHAEYEPADIARTMLRLRLAGGLDDAAPAVWRDRFAQGARNARIVADTAATIDFSEAAWDLQQREPSADPQINRLIYREALFAAAMRHDAAQLQTRAETLVAYARDGHQLAEAYEAAIMVARLIGNFDKAWRWSNEAMRRFGLRMPAKARAHHLIVAVARWQMGFMLSRFLRRPVVTENMDSLSRLSSIVAMVAFEREPLQSTLVALRATTRARRFGFRDPIWLSADSFICASLGDYRRAAALGAEALADNTHSDLEAAKIYRALYFGVIWNRPIASLHARGEKVYSIAIAEGDLATAALAIRNDSLLAWRTAPTLAGLLQTLVINEERAMRLGDTRSQHANAKFLTFARALQTPAAFAAFQRQVAEDDHGEKAKWAEDMPVVRVEVLALLGEWAALASLCEQLKGIRRSLTSHPGAVIWRFYESIARLRIGLPLRRGDMRILRRVAVLNPVDHRAKIVLLEADLLRLKGARAESLRGYALAVEIAAALTTRFEAGLITDCAAFGARLLGDDGAAARYAAAAQTIWRNWGAGSKAGGAPDMLDAATDERVAEAQSQAAAAMRADRAKSRFLAEVGHELRTPMQAMQGLLDLASESNGKVDIGELRDVFGSLHSVVDDLTDIGALGAEAPLRLSAIDIVKLLQSEAALFSTHARHKGLTLTTALDGNGGEQRILTDGPRVRQIVRNLLSNAVKFVDRGEIVLRLSSRTIGGNMTALTIAVEDTGPGLREADLAKLFEPFERGGRDDAEGLGLGMALSRRIAQRLGGGLTAENRKRGGARFVLAFTAEHAPPPAVAAPDAPPARILLVEDVPLNRRLVATLLRNSGHTVEEAGDGAEALSAWARGDFDLVFLDLGLPDMDGMKVLERMRADGDGGGRTPVIVLTASAEEASDRQALAAGAVRVLHKPVSGQDLREALRETLQQTPHLEGTLPGDLTHALRTLEEEAQHEIRIRAEELLADAARGEASDILKRAHKLAGLAGQFGEARLAAAADLLEKSAASGSDRTQAVQALADALAPLLQTA